MEPTKAFGLVLLLLVVWSIYNAHRDPGLSFNFFDLLMENGRLSKLSCMALGSWALHTWIMIDLEVSGKMTETYITTYGTIWVAPILLKLFAPKEV